MLNDLALDIVISEEKILSFAVGGAPADDLGGRMDFETALREVLKSALIHDGLSRGLHETTKALDKRQALLCILAENCDEAAYKKLVQALCQEHQIPLLTVPDNMQLGKYASVYKGNMRKIKKCSYLAVKDWVKKGLTIDFVNKGMKQQQAKKFTILFVLLWNKLYNINYEFFKTCYGLNFLVLLFFKIGLGLDQTNPDFAD